MSSFRKSNFPIFEPSQILTHTRLNELRDYLDAERRVAITGFTGSGIVAGLEVYTHYVENQLHVVVLDGIGITSQGHVIEVPEQKTFTRYRDYQPESRDVEGPWKLKSSSSVGFLELIAPDSPDYSDPAAQDLISLGDGNDYSVVLYLEQVTDLEENCFGDCYDRGGTASFKLKFLLVLRSEQEEPSENGLEFNFGPGHPIRNFTLNDEPPSPFYLKEACPGVGSSYDDYFEVHLQVPREITKSGKQEDTPIHIGKVLDAKIRAALLYYTPLLGLTPEELFDLFSKVCELRSQESYSPATYLFYKELAAAYNELIDAIESLGPLAPVADNAHKRFLIAGFFRTGVVLDCNPWNQGNENEGNAFRGAAASTNSYSMESTRHHFRPAPAFRGGDWEHVRIKMLALRIGLIIKNMNIGDGVEVTPVHTHLVVTPEVGPGNPSSQRAIPYVFYPGATESGNTDFDTLLKVWNPLLGLRNHEGRIRGYFRQDRNGTDEQNNPMLYFGANSPFFLIEGHIGRNIESVYDDLVSIRDAQGAPFELIPLEEGDSATFIPDSDGGSHELQVRFSSSRNQLRRMLGELIHSIKGLDLPVLLQWWKHYGLIPAASSSDNFLQTDQLESLRGMLTGDSETLDLVLLRDRWARALDETLKVYKNLSELILIWGMEDSSRFSRTSDLHLLQLMNHTLHRLEDFWENEALNTLLGSINELGILEDYHRTFYTTNGFLPQHPKATFLSGVYAGGTFLLVHVEGKVCYDLALPDRRVKDCCPVVVEEPNYLIRPVVRKVKYGAEIRVDLGDYVDAELVGAIPDADNALGTVVVDDGSGNDENGGSGGSNDNGGNGDTNGNEGDSGPGIESEMGAGGLGSGFISADPDPKTNEAKAYTLIYTAPDYSSDDRYFVGSDAFSVTLSFENSNLVSVPVLILLCEPEQAAESRFEELNMTFNDQIAVFEYSQFDKEIVIAEAINQAIVIDPFEDRFSTNGLVEILKIVPLGVPEGSAEIKTDPRTKGNRAIQYNPPTKGGTGMDRFRYFFNEIALDGSPPPGEPQQYRFDDVLYHGVLTVFYQVDFESFPPGEGGSGESNAETALVSGGTVGGNAFVVPENDDPPALS